MALKVVLIGGILILKMGDCVSDELEGSVKMKGVLNCSDRCMKYGCTSIYTCCDFLVCCSLFWDAGVGALLSL